jgi:hypothetical protein
MKAVSSSSSSSESIDDTQGDLDGDGVLNIAQYNAGIDLRAKRRSRADLILAAYGVFAIVMFFGSEAFGDSSRTDGVLRVENLAQPEDVRHFYDALKRGDLETFSSVVLAPGKPVDSVFFPRSFLERCLGADEWTFLSKVGVVVESKSMGPTLLTVVHSTYVKPPEPYLKHFRPGNWVNLNRVDAWIKVGDEWKVIPQEMLSGRVLLNFDELTKITDFRLWEQGDLEKLLAEVKEEQLRRAAGDF